LISVVVLWAMYFVLASARWEVLGIGHSGEMMMRRFVVVLGGMAVTVALWTVLRLFDAGPMWRKALAALVLSLPASLLLAHINNAVFADMNDKVEKIFTENVLGRAGGSNEEDAVASENEPALFPEGGDLAGAAESDGGLLDSLGALTDIAFSRYFMMLAWCSIYLALLTGEQARAAERREQQFRNAAKAAELRSLRYQVNPHFLFNTLNSLSSLVMTGKGERAEQMIQTMSRFYRHSLADDPTGDVPLADEFDLQRLYLDIETVRFPDRLRCVFDLPNELGDARVPGMILQPLVENSVRYAVSPVSRPVTITIAAREEFDRLVVTVSDDGPGSPAGTKNGFGIGVANVRDRLEARFGPDVTLETGPVPGGYRTEMRIPLTRNGRNYTQ
jgi:two-component system, LytTR family, sensor kinase